MFMWAKRRHGIDIFVCKPLYMRMRLLVWATLTLCLASCKKDDKPRVKLSGTWKGMYGHRQINAPGDTVLHIPTFAYTMIFNENGTMVVYDGEEGATLMAKGVYSLKNRRLYGQYSYVRGGGGEYSVNAVLEKPDSMAGTWHIGYGGQTGGKFYLKK